MKFSKGNKNLYYIGANHTNDIKSKTFKLIKNVIKKNELVIIEGVDYDYGLSPDILQGSGEEVKYAATLAIKNKTPFSGVEPSDKQIYTKLIRSGIKKKDVILFEILQEYKVFCRNGITNQV